MHTWAALHCHLAYKVQHLHLPTKELLESSATLCKEATTGRQWVVEHISKCRVHICKGKNGESKKVIVMLQAWPAGMEVLKTVTSVLMTAFAAEWLHGEAPAGDLERQAQAALKTLTK